MTQPSLSSSRLAEANMKRWLHREELDKKIAVDENLERLGPYIVISRQIGAKGEEIASLLGEKLGWDLLDKEIMESIAKDRKVSEQLVEFVDEKHVTWLTELFEAWIEGQDFCQEGYVHDLSKLLMIAAQHGNFVMVGRGSQFILPREFGLFVRLHAPVKTRVANVIVSHKLSEKKAKKLVKKTDQERGEFLKTYFRNDGTEPSLYDIVIDTSRFTEDSIAKLIQNALESRISQLNK